MTRSTSQEPIPFNRARPEGRELEYIGQSLHRGHTSSSGQFSQRAAEMLRHEVGGAEVLLTTSCTTALELSSLMLDLGPGDRVVVPSFTFVSTALAFARTGASIVFADIEPSTLGMDPQDLERVMDDRVRAVVPVHYAGIGCDLEGIRAALGDRPDVAVIEDNSHGLFGRVAGRPLGSFGRFSTLSFHDTKNIVCGEGGALVINDPADVDRARILYEKGTDRRAFMLGQVDKYTWRDTGSSFGLSDTLAAYLVAQLEQADSIQARRRRLYEHYEHALAPLAGDLGFTTPHVPDDRDPAHHLYYVLLPSQSIRDTTMRLMRDRGVNPTFHYVPLHSSEAGRKFTEQPTECPVTDDVSSRLMRLPFYNGLALEDAQRVVETFLTSLRTAIRQLS